MLKPGTKYTVTCDKFYAAPLRKSGLTRIPKGSRLQVLKPDGFPSYPSENPPKRVRFAFARKHYWQFEASFLTCCRIFRLTHWR